MQWVEITNSKPSNPAHKPQAARVPDPPAPERESGWARLAVASAAVSLVALALHKTNR